MKLFSKALMLLTLLFICSFAAAQKNKNVTPKELRHVVLFKLKDGVPADSIQLMVNTFKALATKIKSLKRFEFGLNNSPENLNQGFTHCFVLTFISEKDRDAYLPNPDHKTFVAAYSPIIDKACVVDYWVDTVK
jgi:Stress responsive A/B Barrel Domain